MGTPGPCPFDRLPFPILDRVVGGLELWDLAAARSACRALRAAAGRRARRLCFSPASLQCELGGGAYVQVACSASRTGAGLRDTGGGGRGRRCMRTQQRDAPSRAATCAAPVPHALSPPQKRRPTDLQLFPNAREVVLKAREVVSMTKARRFKLRLAVLGVFRLPGAPADAAAARAALAGVTRLGLDGLFKPSELAAAVLHLPGLRAVSLVCNGCGVGACGADRRYAQADGADALASDLLAALAGCPRLESLEWDLQGWHPEGAAGSGPGTNEGHTPIYCLISRAEHCQHCNSQLALHTTTCPTLAPSTLQAQGVCLHRSGACPPCCRR
jgi:hypothetical protein